MTTVAERTAVTISFETACDHDSCAQFAFPLHKQLAGGRYDVCSVLPMPKDAQTWREEHRTARKRAARARRLGYSFSGIRRHNFADDIHEINTSLGERQGRPMSAGYNVRPSASPDPLYPCPRHGVHPYGVLQDDKLVAYLWIYRAGELALVSQILGHGEHLQNDVMYRLFAGMLETEILHGGFLVYNRHDSGTDGLRYFKERCGFKAMGVEWAL